MKARMIFIGIVAAISFAISLGLTIWLVKPAPAPQQATTQPSTQPAVASTDLLHPKERQMDELIIDLQQRLGECRTKERQLKEWESRLQIAQAGVDKQAQELEQLRIDLLAPYNRLKEARSELLQTRITIQAQERTNLQQVAAVYDKMDSAASSKIIADMCTTNQIEDAVKLLRYMGERPVAMLMSEMTDKSLAARLSLMLKRVQEQ